MRRFTLLALISVQEAYYFNLLSCVRTNLPSRLACAREMAIICGQETDYFNKPCCVARNIAMIFGHKTNLPSSLADNQFCNQFYKVI